jgi:hypothetical protein
MLVPSRIGRYKGGVEVGTLALELQVQAPLVKESYGSFGVIPRLTLSKNMKRGSKSW